MKIQGFKLKITKVQSYKTAKTINYSDSQQLICLMVQLAECSFKDEHSNGKQRFFKLLFFKVAVASLVSGGIFCFDSRLTAMLPTLIPVIFSTWNFNSFVGSEPPKFRGSPNLFFNQIFFTFFSTL